MKRSMAVRAFLVACSIWAVNASVILSVALIGAIIHNWEGVVPRWVEIWVIYFFAVPTSIVAVPALAVGAVLGLKEAFRKT